MRLWRERHGLHLEIEALLQDQGHRPRIGVCLTGCYISDEHPFHVCRLSLSLSLIQVLPLTASLLATDLMLPDRRNRQKACMNRQRNNPNDPKALPIVLFHISKHNRKHNTPKVPGSTGHSTHHTISLRLNMRYQREDCTIARLEEHSHTSDQSKHGRLVVRVGEADGEEEAACDEAEAVDEELLDPEVGESFVEEVGNDAAGGACDDVEEAEHSGPLTTAGLS